MKRKIAKGTKFLKREEKTHNSSEETGHYQKEANFCKEEKIDTPTYRL